MNFYKNHILNLFSFYAGCMDMERITDQEIAQAMILGMGDRAVGVACEVREILAPTIKHE